ncbi:MAG: hypothetical protein M0T80_13355 [Actinomycetota bacterium]|nr:hypothetical protein [Actinomycetota bacterium]
MTQPDYVPVLASDRVRPAERLEVPGPWHQARPAEQTSLTPPSGDGFGVAGPDAGYGLKLAKRFEDRLALVRGEEADDAVAGCFACGARRAASIGRAPVLRDFEWAYTLWGYLGTPPSELVIAREPVMRGAAHDYHRQRRVADAVTPKALKLSPAEVAASIADWRSLLRF